MECPSKVMYQRLGPQLVDPKTENRLEHDSSDLMSELIQLWILNLMALLGGAGGGVCLEEVGPMKKYDYEEYLVPALVSCSLHFSFLKSTK